MIYNPPITSHIYVAWSESIYGYFSFLGLPCHTQPTNSYVYYAVSSHGFSNFPGYILLVGCMNNTNVTIVPTQYANITMPANPQSSISAYKTYRLGESNTFVIHAGQTIRMYQAFADISGSKIISDAPLTVISGHTTAQIPLGINDADPMATQVTPTITWGKEFLLSPHHNRDTGQFYKIIAHRPGTNIQRRCGTGPTVNATLSSGEVYQFNTSYASYCSLISNKPVYVAHVGPSTFFNGGTFGDPTLNTVPPISQYLHSIEYTRYFAIFSGVNLLIPRDQYFSNNLIIDNTLYSHGMPLFTFLMEQLLAMAGMLQLLVLIHSPIQMLQEGYFFQYMDGRHTEDMHSQVAWVLIQ